DDEIVAKDQPYVEDASPNAQSPEYVPESDLEAHPEDDDDEDPEEDPLPSANRREDRPEVTLPPRKRLGIALGPGYEVGESSSAAARPAGGSTDASDLVRGKVMSLRTTVLGQMTEIRELHTADRRRQIVISELLRADHRRSTEIIELRTALQGQVTALQGQVVALQA
nr:hypothetical protein [Tanacetum cinerariifolium]